MPVPDAVLEILNTRPERPQDMTPAELVDETYNLALKMLGEGQNGFLVVYPERFAVQPYPAEDLPSLLLTQDVLTADKLPESIVLDLVEFLCAPQMAPI